jgi:hypothetical protein
MTNAAIELARFTLSFPDALGKCALVAMDSI